jgi:dTDP-glucose 4,6-dehydratase
MRTVLVTGGCGFIGSHFVRLLLSQTPWRVVNIDKLTYAGDVQRVGARTHFDRYRFMQADIADRSAVETLLREERPWALVNFAAESHVDRSILDAAPFLEANIIGVQVLIEAARRYGVERFVQVSTDEVYGDLPGAGRAAEAHPLRPSSPYAASKAAADLLCLAYHRTFGLPILITRSSNNYGPWQFPEKLVPVMIRNALAGKALPLYGDGMQERDWLHVTDNVDAIFAVLDRGKVGGIYNIATGFERTNVEIVQALRQALASEAGRPVCGGVPEIRFIKDRPGHDRRYALDAEKVRRDLGWFPRVSFEDGILRTVRWYLEHRDWVEHVAPRASMEYGTFAYGGRSSRRAR